MSFKTVAREKWVLMELPRKSCSPNDERQTDENFNDLLNLLNTPYTAAPARAQPSPRTDFPAASTAKVFPNLPASSVAFKQHQRVFLPRADVSYQTGGNSLNRHNASNDLTVVNELEEILHSREHFPHSRAVITAVSTSAKEQSIPSWSTGAHMYTSNTVGVGSEQTRGRFTSGPALPPFRGSQNNIRQQVVSFCRYAIGCVLRPNGRPANLQSIEHRVSRLIEEIYNQWARNIITDDMLFQNIRSLVRKSCPQAANRDVVSEFRIWYNQRAQGKIIDAANGRAVNPHARVDHQAKTGNFCHPLFEPNRRRILGHSSAPAQNVSHEISYCRAHQRTALYSNPAVQQIPLQQKGVENRTAIPQAETLNITPSAKSGFPVSVEHCLTNNVTISQPDEKSPNTGRTRVERNMGNANRLFQARKGTCPMPVSEENERTPTRLARNVVTPQMKQPMNRTNGQQHNMKPAPAASGTAAQVWNGASPEVTRNINGNLQVKKTTNLTMGLNVLDNVVDIDKEQSNLDTQPHEKLDAEMSDANNCSNILLNRDVLGQRIERAMRKHNLEGPVTKEIIEIMSLAAQERLRDVFENLRELALSREEGVGTKYDKPCSWMNVREKLEKERDDEDLRLRIESQNRMNNRKRARGGCIDGMEEKQMDGKVAVTETGKQNKMRRTKEEAANSSQQSAIKSFVSGIHKKRKEKQNGRVESGKLATSAARSATDSAQVYSTISETDDMGAINTKPSVVLADCLALFCLEPNLCKSTLVYRLMYAVYTCTKPQS